MCDILNFYNPLIESQQISTLSANYEISFALERMYKNILLINSGINAKEIFVSNTTLYAIAAQEYKDATLWTYLATVNNLLDPDITQSMTLVIPPKPADNLRFGT